MLFAVLAGVFALASSGLIVRALLKWYFQSALRYCNYF
jgi:hypothetical protein